MSSEISSLNPSLPARRSPRQREYDERRRGDPDQMRDPPGGGGKSAGPPAPQDAADKAFGHVWRVGRLRLPRGPPEPGPPPFDRSGGGGPGGIERLGGLVDGDAGLGPRREPTQTSRRGLVRDSRASPHAGCFLRSRIRSRSSGGSGRGPGPREHRVTERLRIRGRRDRWPC